MTTGSLTRAPEATGEPRAPLRRGRPGTAWRGWLAIALVVAAGATLAALVTAPAAPQYLSPRSVAPTGTHALADVLAELGRTVQVETSVPAAVAAATAGSTLVITNPSSLSRADLGALARVPASVLLVGPTRAALAAIDPIVVLIEPPQPVLVTPPDCSLRAAVLAGTVDTGGENLLVQSLAEPVEQCYTSTSGPTLVQARVRGRLVTVLGAGALLTNADLARQGNAALAINLLATRRIVWLVPPAAVPASARSARPKSFFSLVPLAAYLVAAQLAFALLLTIGWRSRRLGPVVTEPLPVVVRAAETVIGHGRLYQARHARGRAAAALRDALRARLGPIVGLPAGTDSDAMIEAVAQRSSADQQRIRDLLYGPAPRTDAALLALARGLDDLAREVGVS
jgi:Domain of unknown function (DUF4350)